VIHKKPASFPRLSKVVRAAVLFPNPAKKTLSLMILLSGIFVKYLTKNVGMIGEEGICGDRGCRIRAAGN